MKVKMKVKAGGQCEKGPYRAAVVEPKQLLLQQELARVLGLKEFAGLPKIWVIQNRMP